MPADRNAGRPRYHVRVLFINGTVGRRGGYKYGYFVRRDA